MPTINARDFLYLAPEIALTSWGLIVLTVDFALLRRRSSEDRQRTLGWLSLAGVALTVLVMVRLTGLYMDVTAIKGGMSWLVADMRALVDNDPTLFNGTIAGDVSTFWMNLILVLLLALVVVMSLAWRFTDHWGEYYALLFWATVGMMLLVAAEELLTLFLTLETMTLCLYLATAFEKARRRSAEGGLKYFVYGSVSSALFLFGLSLIYGLTGTTRLVAIRGVLVEAAGGGPAVGLAGNVAGATAVLLILVGFGFKVAAVPFHQWAPDAYEGAPAPVTGLIAAGSKLASFVAMMKVLVFALGPWSSRPDRLTSPGWIGVVAAIAAVTMTYGNLAALAQKNLKRMLAYSSIAHAGYMLVGVLAASISTDQAPAHGAAGAVLFYLITYGFTTVGAFALAAWLVRDTGADDIDQLNGLGRRTPGLALCIVLLMLSLIGMPPLAGFFGKLYMFMEALRTREAGRLAMIGLVALGLANSVISAFYYVRVLKAMYLRDEGPRPVGEAPASVRWPIVAATAVAVILGVVPAPLVDQMRAAAVPMLTGSVIDPRFKTEGRPLTPEEIRRREEAARKALEGPGFSGMRPPGGGTPPPAPRKGGGPRR